jgi:spermidine/putrescine transport system permease protein
VSDVRDHHPLSGGCHISDRRQRIDGQIPGERHLPVWRHTPGFGPAVAVVLVFLYLPIVTLIIYAFNANRIVTVWSGFSLHWFSVVVRNRDLQRAAWNSLLVALCASLISSLVAAGAALALRARMTHRTRTALSILINLPLVVPEIVVSITTLVLFSSLNMDYGLGNLIIGHTVFCIPYAFLPIRARLARLDNTLDDAARDLYASELQIYRYIILPLLMPAMVSGLILAFVTSLDDFLISMMVAKAGDTTLPVYVYGMMRVGITPEVNAVSTLIVLIPVLLLSCLLVLFRGRLNFGTEPRPVTLSPESPSHESTCPAPNRGSLGRLDALRGHVGRRRRRPKNL